MDEFEQKIDGTLQTNQVVKIKKKKILDCVVNSFSDVN